MSSGFQVEASPWPLDPQLVLQLRPLTGTVAAVDEQEAGVALGAGIHHMTLDHLMLSPQLPCSGPYCCPESITTSVPSQHRL